jgi:hypothetical protein
MRARAFVSSAGAGGSLVAAGLICFVAVSGLLGFDHWPGASKADRDGTLAMRIPTAKAAGRAATGPRPALVAFTSPRRAATRRGSAVAPSRREVRSPRRSAPAATSTPRAAKPIADPPAASTDPATPAPATPAPAAPVQHPASPPPSTRGPVSNTVSSTRDAVAPVTDAIVPPVAQQPVDQVLDTVEQTAGVVDQVLAP